MKNRLALLLNVLILLCFMDVKAQTNHLKKRLNISASESSVRDILRRMEHQGNFLFSYNSQIANTDRKLSVDYKNESVEKILDDLFVEQLEYKSVGNHIIFIKSDFDKTTLKENKKITYVISGIIVDSQTGALIKSASIHDIQGTYSALTDLKGYFELEIPADYKYRSITFSKSGYHDTIIIIQPLEVSKVNIQLKPEINAMVHLEAHSAVDQEVNQMKMVDFFVSEEVMTHASNMAGLQQKRLFQASFLPYAGTHLSASGTYTNKISLNVLAGYSGGVEGVEIGGLVNIDRGGVKGVQIGGLGNIVGGNIHGLQVGGLINTCKDGVKGAQIGGIFNHNTGAVHGAQIGGIFNDSRSSITGLQLAGIANYHNGSILGLQLSGIIGYVKDSISGAQIAGIANYGDDKISGTQIAGIINTSRKHIDGVQVGGIVNYSKDVNGSQWAGISNISSGSVNGGQVSGIGNFTYGNIKGLQTAGILNICTNTNEGIQIAPILNLARNQNGLQIGLINISDSIKGVSLGLFNYAHHGYRSVELSANEVFFSRLALKSGAKHFYNIYSLEIGKKDNYIWAAGLGFGSSVTLNRHFDLSFELLSSHVNETSIWDNVLNLNNKLSATFDWKISKNFILFAGPSLNVHVSNLRNPDTNDYISKIAFHPFYESSNSAVKTQMWVGGVVGFKF